MKSIAFILNFSFSFLFVASLIAQDTEQVNGLEIFIRKDNKSCFKVIKEKSEFIVKNELEEKVKLFINSQKEIVIPVTGFNAHLEPKGKNNYNISATEIHIPEPNEAFLIRFQIGEASPVLSITPCDDIKKNEKTVSTTKEETKPGKLEKDTYWFIPTEEEERRFGKNSRISGCDAIQQSHEKSYEIVYNYQDQCLCYFEKGEKTTSGHFNPGIDEEILFRAVGYHPYNDSLSIKVKFIDRNMEYGEKFLAMSEEELPDMNKQETGEKTDEAIAGAQSTNSGLVTKIEAFRKEMILFYNLKKSNPNLSIDFLVQCIEHIKTRIILHFEVTSITPGVIREKIGELIEKLDEDEQDELIAKLEEGVNFYEKILSYNQVKFFPVQVKNMDITEVTYQLMQNGKVNNIGPQTFEYFNRGGFKIDFSAGFFVHMLTDHKFNLLHQNVLDTVFTEMDTTMNLLSKGRINQERSEKYDISGAILAHFYPRNLFHRNRFNMAVSTGLIAGKKDSNINLKYLLGLSSLFGSEQRIVITAGTIMGKVSRLAEGLQAGENGTLLDYSDGQSNTVPTRQVFNFSWFVGISYNFGRVNPKI